MIILNCHGKIYIYTNIYKSTIPNNLRYFQLKLIHRCLPRKRILFAAGMTDSPLCNFCNTEPDNLIHIYVTCRKTQEFWIKIIAFANSIFTNITALNTINIIFGTFLSNQDLLSFIVLAAKYYIHCCYWNRNDLVIENFIKKVYEYEYFEEKIALMKDKLEAHHNKWKPFILRYGTNIP